MSRVPEPTHTAETSGTGEAGAAENAPAAPRAPSESISPVAPDETTETKSSRGLIQPHRRRGHKGGLKEPADAWSSARGPHLGRPSREHRRRRLRRRGRRAYIRSVYFLPSLCTLGNAICGFGSMYVSSLDPNDKSPDPLTMYFVGHSFVAAAYLIFIAMIFDVLDGRLARFTRHTTDFGGQLDSLADVISFGVAPAFLALQVFRSVHPDDIVPTVTRCFWAVGALYMSCAALRLARFNVSNEHGEQHHFSFLGLPSPGAAGAVAAFILLQQELAGNPWHDHALATAHTMGKICVSLLPFLVLLTGLLMVSDIRYPHVVNRYLRGRRSLGRLILVVVIFLAIIVAHRYTLAIGAVGYAMSGAVNWGYGRIRRKFFRQIPTART